MLAKSNVGGIKIQLLYGNSLHLKCQCDFFLLRGIKYVAFQNAGQNGGGYVSIPQHTFTSDIVDFHIKSFLDSFLQDINCFFECL